MQAITFRSGKELEQPQEASMAKEDFPTITTPPNQANFEASKEDEQSSMISDQKEATKESNKQKTDNILKLYTPPISFPQCLRKNKLDKQFFRFIEIFKKLHINILFADALEQMPSYVKFMKEILSNKRKLEEHETVMLIEECSAILQYKLP